VAIRCPDTTPVLRILDGERSLRGVHIHPGGLWYKPNHWLTQAADS